MVVRIVLKKSDNLEQKVRPRGIVYYDIMVTSKSIERGRLIEKIGTYSGLSRYNLFTIDTDRLLYWLERGAQCSKRVLKMLTLENISLKVSGDKKI